MRRAAVIIVAVIALLALVYLLFGGYIREQIDLYNYPIAYADSISRASAAYGVPEELICAVIRTESSFEPDAVSHVGAKGLMQIMDATNEDICKRSGMPLEADIFDPNVNIERGTYYLAYLYRQFGSWREAVAAYNAGIGRVRGWLKDERYTMDGKTLYEIPISETRAYVNTVFEAMDKYTELYFQNK